MTFSANQKLATAVREREWRRIGGGSVAADTPRRNINFHFFFFFFINAPHFLFFSEKITHKSFARRQKRECIYQKKV